MPWGSLDRVGRALGWAAGTVLRIRRRVVAAGLRRAGLDARIARRVYAELGTGLVELLWLGGSDEARRAAAVGAHVRLSGEAERALQAALTRGPVVLAATHTGNWELAAFAAARQLGRLGRRLAVVAKPLHVGPFHAFAADLRRRSGLEILAPEGAFGAARATLARGDVVAMAIDQVPDRAAHGLPARFLGAVALCDRAPATLAYRAGATLLVVAARRVGRALEVELLAERRRAPTDTARSFVEDATLAATRALDAFVQASPSSWLWLHRRWAPPRPRRALVAPRVPS